MRVRVLTVGDGDLSYSLALARCFGEHLQLTATTLVSRDELLQTYTRASSNLLELEHRGATVRHRVDATSLDVPMDPPLGIQDHVMFCHPHLGLEDLHDPHAHAARHQVLIAHYLASCTALLDPIAGRIHVTLCGNQHINWALEASARRLQLQIVQQLPVSTNRSLLCGALERRCHREELAPAEAEWAARKRFRVGELGCRHWLSNYGYEHRRTWSDGDMRVDGSVEWVLAGDSQGKPQDTQSQDPTICGVCGVQFTDSDSFESHVSDLGTPSAAPPPAADAEDTNIAQIEKCDGCGVTFASRNLLFKHLKAGCSRLEKLVSTARTVHRLLLMVSYLSSSFSCSHGMGNDTVSAALKTAMSRAWGDDTVLNVSTVTRTARGVHALCAPVVITVNQDVALDTLQEALASTPGLEALGLSSSAVPFADVRKIVKKQTMCIAIPYRELLLQSEKEAVADAVYESSTAIWITFRPIEGGMSSSSSNSAEMLTLGEIGPVRLREHLKQLCCAESEEEAAAIVESVECETDSAVIRMANCEAMKGCVEALNGAEFCHRKVMAMPLEVAQQKLRVHRRAQGALKAMSATKGERWSVGIYADLMGPGCSWVEHALVLRVSAKSVLAEHARAVAGVLVQLVRGDMSECELNELSGATGTWKVPADAMWLQNVQLVESVARWQRDAVVIDIARSEVVSEAMANQILDSLCVENVYLSAVGS